MSFSQTAPQLATDTCIRRLRRIEGLGTRHQVDPRITWYGPAHFSPGRPGSEVAVQAMCGLMEVNGRDGGTPRRLGLEVASVAAGLLAAQGALAGEVAGLRGQPAPVVGTSVLQAGLLLLSHYFVVATGLEDAVAGPVMSGAGPPFRSADGQWFELETLDPESWKELWARLGAASIDLGRAWTMFRWRYERAACSLPDELHEAAARCSLAELHRVAAETEVSLMPLREYGDVLIEPGVGAAFPIVPSTDGRDQRANTVAGSEGGEQSRPLAGIRVIEATSRIQGPFAGMLLRMLGADVLRVQPPQGDYGRAALCLHRGKESVTIDLGTAAGQAALVELVAGADVFLQNWRPGTAAGWRLAFENLAPRNRRLVYANASGWGDPPEVHQVLGTDFLVQAYAGLGQGLNSEDEPAFPSRMILSDLFGGLVTAEAILAGLCRRERTAQACEVHSSLLAGAMSLQAHVLEDMAQGKEKGRRKGRPVWSLLDRPLVTADGVLAMSVDEDETFRRVCEVCDLDLAGGGRAASEKRLAVRLADGAAREWEEILCEAGVAAAVVCEDLAAVPKDPRLSELFEPVGPGALAPRSPWSFEQQSGA